MARAVVPLNFNAFLEKAKLKDDGSNYTDWVRNLRIILIAAQKNYVLEAPLGARPAAGATPDVMNVWQSKADDYSIVQCAMLYGLESGLQRRFERHGAYEMFQELKLIFQANARIERYEVSNKFYSCKMEENSSVSEHILKMSGYNNHLIQLGVNLPDDSVIDRILQSLPPSYKSFVMNYNMQGMDKTIPELFAMLKAAEVEIKKEHQVLMVNKTTSFKKKGKGKKKGNFKKNSKQVAAQEKKPKSGPKPETECFYCKQTGHWKRNCPKYLADKKDGKVNKGICDIHVIDVYLTNARSSTWVFDTGSVANICNSKQGLRIKRTLAKDEVTMRVGNGSKVDVIAVGTLPLHLPSGLVLDLNNCYLVPALSMNIISGSCLL